jgi:hypothetical protein
MVPLFMTAFCIAGPGAGKIRHLPESASAACSKGIADRRVWLHIASQYLGCAWLRGCARLAEILEILLVKVLLFHTDDDGYTEVLPLASSAGSCPVFELVGLHMG